MAIDVRKELMFLNNQEKEQLIEKINNLIISSKLLNYLCHAYFYQRPFYNNEDVVFAVFLTSDDKDVVIELYINPNNFLYCIRVVVHNHYTDSFNEFEESKNFLNIFEKIMEKI